MKKALASVLAVTMAVSMAACGGSSKPAASTAAPAASTAAPAASTAAPATSAEPEFTLLIGSTVQDDSASGKAIIEYFKPYIEEKSEGRIEVDYQGNSVLGSDRELFEALQLNTVQASFGPMSTLSNFEPNYAICDLPFLFDGKEEAYRELDGEFGAKLAENLPGVGMRLLAYGENAFRNISNGVRPIEKMDDLKGLKIRVMESPVNIATYTALGCNPTPMAFSELYTGLSQGTVDGQDNGVVLTYTSKFYEVQKYYTFTGQIYASNGIIVSEAFWQSLPEDLQQVVLDGSLYAMENQRRMNTEMEESLVSEMEAAGMTVGYMADEEIAKMREACVPVWDQMKGELGLDDTIYQMAVAIRDN